jgi:predicted GTPase
MFRITKSQNEIDFSEVHKIADELSDWGIDLIDLPSQVPIQTVNNISSQMIEERFNIISRALKNQGIEFKNFSPLKVF